MGVPWAARDLIERHYTEMYRYAFAMLRGEQAAEDAVQDAFERALTALGMYPEERIRAMMLRAWLYARRIQPENRHSFPSVGEATAAGFRTCKVCRPVAAA